MIKLSYLKVLFIAAIFAWGVYGIISKIGSYPFMEIFADSVLWIGVAMAITFSWYHKRKSL